MKATKPVLQFESHMRLMRNIFRFTESTSKATSLFNKHLRSYPELLKLHDKYWYYNACARMNCLSIRINSISNKDTIKYLNAYIKELKLSKSTYVPLTSFYLDKIDGSYINVREIRFE